MAQPEPQTETLSLRISESLRHRLEQIRDLVSRRKGESVSTSEIAKQLLESAREDRLEVVDLLAKPTESLQRIRSKGQAGHLLSRAEWTVLAHFVQQGAEAFFRNSVSTESLAAILKAFQATYELRTQSASGAASDQQGLYYLGNLPSECRPEGDKRSQAATPDVVRRTVAETLRRMSKPECRPVLAARNLYVLLDQERLRGADALDEALKPYWPALWRVAARGHYAVEGKPVRGESQRGEGVYQPVIPSIGEGGYTLTFARGEGQEFDLLLSFPGPRGPMYPLGPYPKIAEFRTLLGAKLVPRRSWDGEEFFAYLVEREGETEVWFRAHRNGITFGFSEEEWGQVRKLFRRAWEMPEVNVAWEALSLEYGEL
jgi:hypothetical protein